MLFQDQHNMLIQEHVLLDKITVTWGIYCFIQGQKWTFAWKGLCLPQNRFPGAFLTFVMAIFISTLLNVSLISSMSYLNLTSYLTVTEKIWSTSTTLHCKCGTEAASWLALCIRKSRSNILVAWKTKRLLKMGVNYKKWAKNIPKSLKWPVTCAFEKKIL